MELLGRYKNGNFTTTILSDGTKIRETDDNEFIAAFPESFDCKISNWCDRGCPQCHEDSTINGKHGDILNAKFIDTLKPYTEIACGGGNPIAHPDIIPFLEKLKERKVIANITVNQVHFEKQQDLISKLIDEKLIYGLGVSLVNATEEFVNLVKQYDNAVIHVINGILKPSDIEVLKNNNLKMLILGYKTFRRGVSWYEKDKENIHKNQQWLYDNLEYILKQFQVVSFDNLAIDQLNVRRLLSESQWDEFYMGLDGKFTLYIDLVKQKFAKCSIAEKRYDLLDDMVEMFKIVKGEM